MKKKDILFFVVIGVLCSIMIVLFVMLLQIRNSKDAASSDEVNIEPVIVSEQLSIDNRATDKEKTGGVSALSGRQVYYAGLEDCVIGPKTVVYLENLEENVDIYMKYEVTVDGKLVFETDLIPPGEYVEWLPAEVLEAGKTYEVYLKETPYYEESEGNFLALTSPTNMVNITVTD